MFQKIIDAIKDWLWLRRYNKAMKRTGERMVCFHCLQVMEIETGHVLIIDQFRSIAILCLRCHTDRNVTCGQRMDCYWRWFKFKSGLPEEHWVSIESAFVQDWMVDNGD